MEEIKVFYSKETDTLDIGFGHPNKDVVSEEIEDCVVAKKDKRGNVLVLKLSVKAGEVKLPVKAKMKK
jgi:uncharacterized protein YuzE